MIFKYVGIVGFSLLIGIIGLLYIQKLNLQKEMSFLKDEKALCQANLTFQNTKIKALELDIELFKSKVEEEKKKIEARYLRLSKKQVQTCEDVTKVLSDALEAFESRPK